MGLAPVDPVNSAAVQTFLLELLLQFLDVELETSGPNSRVTGRYYPSPGRC